MTVVSVVSHVSQAVRLRFTDEELDGLKSKILRSISLKYPYASDDKAIYAWYTSIVQKWVEAVDRADSTYGLSSGDVRNVVPSIQAAYHNAFVMGKSEAQARREAHVIAQLFLELHLGLLSPPSAEIRFCTVQTTFH